MNIKFFEKLIILICVLGICLLVLYSFFYSEKSINLFSDNSDYLESVVLIDGKLKDLQKNNNILFFKVCQFSRCLDAVYFNPSNSQENILRDYFLYSQNITLKGKYTLYNDKPEIIVYKLL